MSNEFLTRRMDLIHHIDMMNKVNILAMDTSYPVKIKGIVTKIYVSNGHIDKAEYKDYSSTKVIYIVTNQAGDEVVSIQKRNVFDMAGEPLEDLPPTDRYVQIVLDIDNERIYVATLDEMAGGSFKSFRRALYNNVEMLKSVVSDPIIDMENVNLTEFYKEYLKNNDGIDMDDETSEEDAIGKQKPFFPVDVKELKVRKERASIFTVMSPQEAYKSGAAELYHNPNQTFYFDIDNTSKQTLGVELMPSLYAETITPTTESKEVLYCPIDISSPGTIKMFETNVEADYLAIHNDPAADLVGNKIVYAASRECIYQNFSFLRDHEEKVLYQFYDYTPRSSSSTSNKGKKIAPVAKVETEDINRLQSNLVVASFCNPNSDSGDYGILHDSYSNISQTIGIVQTVGNLSEDFKEIYGIDYGSTLYESIMDPDAPVHHPIYNAQYKGYYFDVIDEEGTTPDYYLVIGSTQSGEQLPTGNSIKTIPVRSKDGYISLCTQVLRNININGEPFDLNLEDSVYAPYIRSFWWDDKCDGHTNKGFGHASSEIRSSNDDLYFRGSNSYIRNKFIGNGYKYSFFKTDYESEDNFTDTRAYATLTFNPSGPTPANHTSIGTETRITFDATSAEIDNMISSLAIPADKLETAMFNFRPQAFEPEVEEMAYRVHNGDADSTVYTSDVGVYYDESTNKCYIVSKRKYPSQTFQYTFKYSIRLRDASTYYLDDKANPNVFYRIQICNIVYPHNINLSTKIVTTEHTTIYLITRMYKCVCKTASATHIDTDEFEGNMYIKCNETTKRKIFKDSSLTDPLTSANYTSDKTNGGTKTYYVALGTESGSHSYYDFEMVVKFGATGDEIAENDYYYLRPYKYHIYDTSTNTWSRETIDPSVNYYDISFRTLRVAPYATYQVVPAAKSFYMVKNPWPRPTIRDYYEDNEYGIDYQRWLKSIPCWKLFYCTRLDGTNDDGDSILALEKMKRVNGGIANKFIYNDDGKFRSAYDFLYDLFTRDIGKRKTSDENYFTDLTNKSYFFNREDVEYWADHASAEKSPTAKWEFAISSERVTASIDTALYEIEDSTIDYSVNEANRINAVKIQTGLLTARAIALTDSTGRRLSLNGTDINPIESDMIIWKDLLNGLNNNKAVDVLGYLVGLKKYIRNTLLTSGSYSQTQNHLAYALTVDIDENANAIEISTSDRFGWESTWADVETFYAMSKSIPSDQNVWWYRTGTEYYGHEFPVICMEGTMKSVAISHNREFRRAFYFVTERLYEKDVNTYNTSIEIGRNRLVFNPMDDSTFTDRLSGINEFDAIIGGFPVRCRIASTSSRKFFIKDGFHHVLGRKYFYHESIENYQSSGDIDRANNPMAIGFFKIDGHHSSSTATKVETFVPTSGSEFQTDYVDGLYYSTPSEGIVRGTTRVLYFDPDNMTTIQTGSSTTVPVYNPSATGYSNLYTDTTFVAGLYKVEFDNKGRVINMTAVTHDPQF